MDVLVTAQMKGPFSSSRVLMRRHWHMMTSIWPKRSVASSATRLTMRAPLERTASISARCSWMRRSRVMMSHSWRAVSGSRRVERGRVGDGALRPHPSALDGSARVARVGDVGSELDEDLRDAEQAASM